MNEEKDLLLLIRASVFNMFDFATAEKAVKALDHAIEAYEEKRKGETGCLS